MQLDVVKESSETAHWGWRSPPLSVSMGAASVEADKGVAGAGLFDLSAFCGALAASCRAITLLQAMSGCLSLASSCQTTCNNDDTVLEAAVLQCQH